MENETEIEKYLIDNYLYKNSRLMAKELNLHEQLVCKILKKLCLNRKKYIDNYILKNYYKEGPEVIGKFFNYNPQSVSTIARKLGLETKKPKKKNFNKEFIQENYESMGAYKISEILGCTYKSITTCASRLGLTHDRVFLPNPDKEEDYFRIWSYNMAYILGFTIGDGYISGKYTLEYGLNTKDKIILEFIRDQISPKSIVRDYKKFDKRTNKYYDKSVLRIGSKTIVESLKELGVIQAKTGKEVLPPVPEEYKYSLLCGIHDSDGYLRACPKRGYHFQFTCASEQFLKSIQNEICGGIGKVTVDKTWFRYLITCKEPCQDLDYKMTKNVSFYLKRKHFPKDLQIEKITEPEYQIIGSI